MQTSRNLSKSLMNLLFMILIHKKI